MRFILDEPHSSADESNYSVDESRLHLINAAEKVSVAGFGRPPARIVLVIAL